MKSSLSHLTIPLLFILALVFPSGALLSEPEPEYPDVPEVEYLFGGGFGLPGFGGLGIPLPFGGSPQAFMQFITESFSGFGGILHGYCNEFSGEIDALLNEINVLEDVYDGLLGDVSSAYTDLKSQSFSYWNVVANKVSSEALVGALPTARSFYQSYLGNTFSQATGTLLGQYNDLFDEYSPGAIVHRFTDGPRQSIDFARQLSNGVKGRLNSTVGDLNAITDLIKLDDNFFENAIDQGLPLPTELVGDAKSMYETYVGLLDDELANVGSAKALASSLVGHNGQLRNLYNSLQGGTPLPQWQQQANSTRDSCNALRVNSQNQANQALQDVNSLRGEFDQLIAEKKGSQAKAVYSDIRAAHNNYSSLQNKAQHYQDCVNKVQGWQGMIGSLPFNAADVVPGSDHYFPIMDYYTDSIVPGIGRGNAMLNMTEGVISDMRSEVSQRVNGITSIPANTAEPYMTGINQTVEKYTNEPFTEISNRLNQMGSTLDSLSNQLLGSTGLEDALNRVDPMPGEGWLGNQISQRTGQIDSKINQLQSQITGYIPQIASLDSLVNQAEQMFVGALSEVLEIEGAFQDTMAQITGFTDGLGIPSCGAISGDILDGLVGEFGELPSFNFDLFGSFMDAFGGAGLPFDWFGFGGFGGFGFAQSAIEEPPYRVAPLATRRSRLFRQVEGCNRPTPRVRRFLRNRRGLSDQRVQRRMQRFRRFFRECRTYNREQLADYLGSLDAEVLFANYMQQQAGVALTVGQVQQLRANIKQFIE